MSDPLSATFSALADPTRRAILAQLATGEATVTQLALPFALKQPSITKHIKVLEHAGLISRRRAAQTRPCKLETTPLKDASRWIETYKHLWEDSFDRLDDYLRKLQATPTQE